MLRVVQQFAGRNEWSYNHSGIVIMSRVVQSVSAWLELQGGKGQCRALL